MEQLNRVELKGRVGAIQRHEVAGHVQATLSVVTEYVYKNSNGQVTIESCWTQVSGWEGRKISFEGLEKGSPVHVIGRLRSQKYTDANGCRHSTLEVLASQIEKIEEES